MRRTVVRLSVTLVFALLSGLALMLVAPVVMGR